MGFIWKTIRYLGFLALAALTIWLMYRDSLSDPFDPNRQGSQAHGHNLAGAFHDGVAYVLIELVALYLIVRPFSDRGLVLRLIVALFLCVPWTILSMILAGHAHAGGVVTLHWLWLAGVALLLVITLIGALFSGLSDLAPRKSRKS